MSDTPNKPPLTRREFLGLAWMGALGLGALKLLEVLGQTTLPRRPKGEFGGEFEVGTLAELPKAGDPPLAFPAGRFWLVHTETGLLALHRACTHLDCLVSWDDSAQKFVCPCHGSEFGHQGNCLQGPASRNLDRFPLRVVTPEGQVVVQTELGGAPLPVETLVNGEQADVTPEALVVVDTAKKIQGDSIA